MAAESADRFELADLLLDMGSRRVYRHDDELAMGSLTFDLLAELVRSAPHLVSYEQLGERVWPGRSASLETIAQRLSMLRRALSDSASAPRYVEVVRGKGLRLVAAVTCVPDAPTRGVESGRAERSLAVLPFQDLSREQDRQFFADGLVEDLTTDLAQIPQLLVVSNKSTFRFRGAETDLDAVAAKLGVNYLLTGSIRRRGEAYRVTARLIDARSGENTWSKRYDMGMADLADMQDALTHEIVTSLDVELISGEHGRYRRNKFDNHESTETLYRGLYCWYRFERAAHIEARMYFEKLTVLEPHSPLGHSWLAAVWTFALVVQWEPPDVALAQLASNVTRSLAIDNDDPQALIGDSYLKALTGELDAAAGSAARAIAVAPHMDEAHFALGWIQNISGEPAAAVSSLEVALRLCPMFIPVRLGVLATAYRNLGRYADSERVFQRCQREFPDWVYAYTGLAATHGLNGDWEKARAAVRDALAIDPEYTVGKFVTPNLYRDKRIMEDCARVLRKAGLPG